MHSQLNHIIAQQRVADLSRIAGAHQVAAHTDRPRRVARVRPVARVARTFARISAARA